MTEVLRECYRFYLGYVLILYLSGEELSRTCVLMPSRMEVFSNCNFFLIRTPHCHYRHFTHSAKCKEKKKTFKIMLLTIPTSNTPTSFIELAVI